MRNIEEARAYQAQEKSRDNFELWEAILAAHEALVALGGPGLPEQHVNRAKANLIRAGVVPSGDFTDEELNAIATADGTRLWSPEMGTIFKDEPIIGEDGETYIATVQREAQAGWGPGTEGGRTLFRPLRKEPEAPGEYLIFVWGEHVAFGHVRRDPIDEKLYTPIHETGVTLYEPHYPHLVPSEYELYEEEGGGGEEPVDPSGVPDWNDLEANHTFAVGDHFTYEGTEYVVLRAFNKQVGWEPPALLNDFYEVYAAGA